MTRLADVLGVRLASIGPHESLELELSVADVHLLLGPMGAGKSTVLRSLAVPFGVKVCGLAHNEMRELVTAGAGTGSIELVWEDESGEAKTLAWSPGKKVAPATIRKLFGLEAKDLEHVLVPGSLVRMKPDARRKAFSRALGAADDLDEQKLLDAGLSGELLEPVRLAIIKRGIPSGVNKATEMRRERQRRLDDASIGAPVDDPILDLEGKTIARTSELSTTDVDDLMQEAQEKLAAAEGSTQAQAAVAEERAARRRALVEDLRGIPVLEDLDDLHRRRDDAVRAQQAGRDRIVELAAEREPIAKELEMRRRHLASVEGLLEERIVCNGWFAEEDDPERRECPRASEVASTMLARKASLTARVEELAPRDEDLERRIADHGEVVAAATKAIEELDEELRRDREARERRRPLLEEIDRIDRAAPPAPATSSEEDPTKVREYLDWLRAVRAQVDAFAKAKVRWDARDRDRAAWSGEIERLAEATELLEEMQNTTAADPIPTLEAKVAEIAHGILKEQVSISPSWELFYGGRRLELASKGEQATIDLALRAALTELVGFPILLVDDLDAIDDVTRAGVLGALGSIRERFAKVVCACWSSDPTPTPDETARAAPWLQRWRVGSDGALEAL